MVKFLLQRRAGTPAQANRYRCGNHMLRAKVPDSRRGVPIFKILIEFEPVKFDENLCRISGDFTQKLRVNSNANFKPVCYGLVQRRRNSRRRRRVGLCFFYCEWHSG
jgi:hypothetical protein